MLDDASDIAEREDEKGDTTDIKDELENYVNGNESVYHNQIYSIINKQMRKNVSGSRVPSLFSLSPSPHY